MGSTKTFKGKQRNSKKEEDIKKDVENKNEDIDDSVEVKKEKIKKAKLVVKVTNKLKSKRQGIIHF